ncbi:unnamed protein product [Zymoseptoria tritici ST99CH_1E4]|uniref:RNase III domain-containing protein n=1 Tax=Zymoseptoria tritici ST99CH_1E4 TaxID=1276532 RepID=A0A2H1FIX2_ZYMTR|nr:unnamed protein product [Zymoseptoria tritici ST99CH_1E4]
MATNTTIDIIGHATLRFASGTEILFEYAFKNPALLFLACTVEQSLAAVARKNAPPNNRQLAITGDAIARAVLSTKWIEGGGSTLQWESIHGRGIATNRYLAHMAEIKGVMENLAMLNGCSAAGIPINHTIKATMVEAIFGAVWLDSKDLGVVEEVMRLLGVFWPVDAEVERMLLVFLGELRQLGVLGGV